MDARSAEQPSHDTPGPARRWLTVALALVLASLAVGSRVPYLHDPMMLLTGDEAVVGLMGKHVAQGGAWPVWFYGQSYGLTLVEALAGAVAFSIADVGSTPLRFGMLGLFACGVVLFFLAARRAAGEALGFGLAVLLVFVPSWTVWSHQARGGYLTAFLLTPVLVWLAFGPWDERRRAKAAAVVVLTALLALAQPLWVPGVLPVVLWPFLRERRWLQAAGLLAAMGLFGLGARFAADAYTEWAVPITADVYEPRLDPPADLATTLAGLPRRVWDHLTWDVSRTRGANVPMQLLGGAWCAVLLVLLAVQAVRLVTRRWHPWSHVLCVSVVATIAAAATLNPQRRYLLPLSGLAILWAGVELARFVHGRRVRGLVVAVGVAAATGIGALGIVRANPHLDPEQPRPLLSAEACMERFVEGLLEEDVRYVYSLDRLLQWQILFYSDERILARWLRDHRLPAVERAVDRALRGGERCAIVGFRGYSKGLETYRPERLLRMPELPFLAYLDPEPELLRELKFELHPAR